MKIKADMTVLDTCMAMGEGNPGAIVCVIEMMNQGMLLDLLMLDTKEVYGEKLYMLWNDCCDRDMEKYKKTLELIRTGAITDEQLHANLNQCRARSFI